MIKVKNAGTLIELDPNKKYIMLIDAEAMSEEHVAAIKLENGSIIFGPDILSHIVFIENSDKIVDIKIKYD